MSALPLELVSEGGIMGELIRKHDWSQTEVGAIATWPQSLLTSVSIMLSSRFPMIIFWGPNLEIIYNDSYIPIFGARHPVLGKTGREVWGEVWSVIHPMFQQAFAGEATWSDDQLLNLTRNNYLEECFFTWSYSPIRMENGVVGGILTPITETTKCVLGERRLRSLREFGSRAPQLASVSQACSIAADIFSTNNADIPFSALYLLDPSSPKKLVLKSTSGVAKGSPAAPFVLLLNAPNVWPVAEVIAKKSSVHVRFLEKVLGHLPGGLWPESSQSAVVLPILGGADLQPLGVLVLGVNVRRAFDDDYMGYFELVAGQVSNAICSAKIFEEEKKRAEALSEIDRTKTAFFNNVSHELRTPLTLILGPLADVLKDSAHPLADGQRERMVLAQRNAMRLLRLVNSLLDFSRIEAGRTQATYTQVNVARYTQELASVFRAAFDKAGVALGVHCDSIEEDVYVDMDMWEKIVYNLLSNALKYTIKGSVNISISKKGNMVELHVQDTGVGIAEDQLVKVFERFHRVENSDGRSFEGTGIGLSLTHELVKLHGGYMTLNSKLGVGSTFAVYIPFGASHLPPKQIQKKNKHKQVSGSFSQLGQSYVEEALRWLPGLATAPDLSIPIGTSSLDEPTVPGRILLVDDNADMRAYLSNLLQKRWEVTTACDGVQALDAMKSNSFDLVLSDVMMPRMDGFKFLENLRNQPELKLTPVILLSARAGEDAAVEGFHAGAADYLIKPFSAKELFARVSAQLEHSPRNQRRSPASHQAVPMHA